jgi:hypothetical protein
VAQARATSTIATTFATLAVVATTTIEAKM